MQISSYSLSHSGSDVGLARLTKSPGWLDSQWFAPFAQASTVPGACSYNGLAARVSGLHMLCDTFAYLAHAYNVLDIAHGTQPF